MSSISRTLAWLELVWETPVGGAVLTRSCPTLLFGVCVCVCRHGLRMENLPCFIPNDHSKKRLIQDTEDWQPRTGTTQSRSFRILAQLTGTDYSKTWHAGCSETAEGRGGWPLLTSRSVCRTAPFPCNLECRLDMKLAALLCEMCWCVCPGSLSAGSRWWIHEEGQVKPCVLNL